MRWMMIAVAMILVGIGSYAFLPGSSAPLSTENKSPAPSPVDRLPRIFAGGVVEGSQPELGLKFEIAGRLKAVHVREGDLVQEGDLLAELDSELQELNLAEARAQQKLAIAERDRLLARRKVRTADQPSRETASAMDRTRSKTERTVTTGPIVRVGGELPDPAAAPEELSLAEARVSLAETVARRERLMLDKTRLIAPAPLLVVRVEAAVGELTGPTAAQNLVTLAYTDRLRIRAFVEEFDAPHVAVGRKATVTTAAAPERPIPGVVAHCSSDLRPHSRHHRNPDERLDPRAREILVDIDESPDLLLGLPVEVMIER